MRMASIVSASFLLLVAGMVGCTSAPPTKASLTYQTSPAGGEIFEGGRSLGVEPVTRTYSSDGKSNSIQTPDVKAVWPSGAETVYFTILPVGADRVATLERPAAAPGLQNDMDHAKTVAATREREKERLKTLQKHDIAQASARCKEQQSGSSLAVSDDCM